MTTISGWICLWPTVTFIRQLTIISGAPVMLNRLCCFAICATENSSVSAPRRVVVWLAPGLNEDWPLVISMATVVWTW